MSRVRADRHVPRDFLSPAVRRVAAERGIDLAALQARSGSGTGGRVTIADVVSAGLAVSEDTSRSTSVPLPRMRARAAANLVRAKSTAAHAWIATPADYTAIDTARSGTGLTALAFVARAVIDGLRAFPICNATVRDGIATPSEGIHLGIAVDLDHQGLIVPVVRNAQDLRLRALGGAIAATARKARAGELVPDDVTGGTFTITNPGGRGTFLSVPIIPVPQVAILSTDGITKRVVASDTGGLEIRWIGMLGLSFDQRVVDPASAAGFLARVTKAIGTRDWDAEL